MDHVGGIVCETRAEDSVDTIVVVTAPATVQKERVLAREAMTEEKFELILSKQTPDAEKRARADYVIETVSIEETRASVQSVLADIREKISDA